MSEDIHSKEVFYDSEQAKGPNLRNLQQRNQFKT
jgi:hypothetical protein